MSEWCALLVIVLEFAPGEAPTTQEGQGGRNRETSHIHAQAFGNP